jgi:hypothetical protein
MTAAIRHAVRHRAVSFVRGAGAAALAACWLLSATASPSEGAPPPQTSPKAGAAVRPAPKRASSPAVGTATPHGRKDLGTLDEINIEGEISVPQVLFITARDRARYHDPFYRRYLKSSADLEIGIPFPLPRGARPCP